ncbi:placenta-specific gene 8 protein-like [Diadema antillarum]|uniref:placenta-specific gene 8 protein-like n=1 Tax=Diadema antillarum TaxID=105358 RepID=UPI003A881E67
MTSAGKYEKCESTEVVITQPATTVIQVTSTNNPLYPRGTPREWSSTLCSCFDDVPICLCGLFLAPCHQCYIATEMNESCCVPCCVPGSMIAMRTQVRGRHNIQGSIMGDCVVTVCPCVEPFSQCQLAREVKNIKAGKVQA